MLKKISLMLCFLVSGTLAQAWFCERLVLGRRAKLQYAQEWNTPQLTDLTSLGERFPDLKPRSMARRRHLFNKDMFRCFSDSTVYFKNLPSGALDVEDYLFEIPLVGKKIHKLHVVMIPNHAQSRGMTNEFYATSLVVSLPWLTASATRMIELTPVLPFDPKGLLFNKGQADYKGNLYLRLEISNWNQDNEKSFLLHEHGHNVGYYLFDHYNRARKPYPSFWEDLMRRDASNIKVHTEGPIEDFAEAFSIYVRSRGALQDSNLRSQYAHRFLALDQIFAQEKQGLLNKGYWDNFVKYEKFCHWSEEFGFLAFGTISTFGACWLAYHLR